MIDAEMYGMMFKAKIAIRSTAPPANRFSQTLAIGARDFVAAAYAGANLSFGPEYLIPKPFDHRLMEKIAPAVARAAAESGVATRPIHDLDAYREKLKTFVYASGATMKPIFMPLTPDRRRASSSPSR